MPYHKLNTLKFMRGTECKIISKWNIKIGLKKYETTDFRYEYLVRDIHSI